MLTALRASCASWASILTKVESRPARRARFRGLSGSESRRESVRSPPSEGRCRCRNTTAHRFDRDGVEHVRPHVSESPHSALHIAKKPCARGGLG